MIIKIPFLLCVLLTFVSLSCSEDIPDCPSRMCIVAGGWQLVEVYVDGVLVGTVDQRDSSSAFQLRWDYPGQLSYGNHTLKLVFVTSNKNNKTNGSIDAVIVR